MNPKAGEHLKAGERTAWCNVTPLLYQDSGATEDQVAQGCAQANQSFVKP